MPEIRFSVDLFVFKYSALLLLFCEVRDFLFFVRHHFDNVVMNNNNFIIFYCC